MEPWHRCAVMLAGALVLAACGGGGAAPTPAATSTSTPVPPAVSVVPGASPATNLELAQGFTAYVVADGFDQPTSVTLSADGAVYVSQREGPVFRLGDADADGVFEEKVAYTDGIFGIHGIAFSPHGPLYLSHIGHVTAVEDTDGDTVGDAYEELIAGLPRGQHESNGIAFGPDGKLYITNGSTCNDAKGDYTEEEDEEHAGEQEEHYAEEYAEEHACVEADERSASILQANPDGTGLRVYASGLRNSYDLVFDPQGRLWATDNGSDPPCNTIDELNLIEDGGDYGWPYAPACDSFQSGIPPVADLGFNTASTGIDYYDGGQFPADYRDSLFATLWGSLDYAPEPSGRILVHLAVEETPDGPQVTVEEFGTGFFSPIDVLMDGDGTLLVLDFGAGKLYRIAYTGSPAE